jgi:hypothetical protein
MRFARTRLGPALVLLAAAALAALATGCGKGEPTTPGACFSGQAAYEEALAAAPGEVRIGGDTPISECLAENQQGGDLAQVGEALVETATRLNAEARTEPGGQANLELGYLLGAAQRGAAETAGIHTDLLRRLEVAARFSPGTGPPLTPDFRAAYRRGFDAGRESG